MSLKTYRTLRCIRSARKFLEQMVVDSYIHKVLSDSLEAVALAENEIKELRALNRKLARRVALLSPKQTLDK